MSLRRFALAFLLAALVPAPRARADEGMWTFDNPPLDEMRRRYGFAPDEAWLEHARLACVRLNDGGSGAFVSPHGLVITNHHVAAGQLQKVSSETVDYIRDGFYARTQAEEMPCPDLELNQLVSMENVTARVLGAVKANATDEEQNRRRKAEIARIEKESAAATGLRSDVVDLYHGGEYWLYRYRKFTDVRLVMAPEVDAANFGGDPDNFVYPRHDLDMAFFRVYENGKPADTPDYFPWSASGAADSEMVFVLGHPGQTERLETVEQLKYERDYALPTALEEQEARRKAFRDFAARGPEQARRVWRVSDLNENSNKSDIGALEGLRDPRFFAALSDRESRFRRELAAHPDLQEAYSDAWVHVALAMEQLTARHREWHYRRIGRGARLADMAGTIVNYVIETGKPNDERYEEYRDSALPSLEFRLFSPAPIYRDLDEFMLAFTLQEDLDHLGPDDAFVKAALGGRSPNEVAHELVAGTKLDDPKVRRALVRGGKKSVESSNDPLIVWMRGLDPYIRELRDWHENHVESVLSREGTRIAQARFALLGKSQYPDATFTLRLSYGKVAGYEQGTTYIPWKTTFYGLFDRAASFGDRPPFQLSKREREALPRLDLSTPLDFVTTNDIIGGNSGSPVVNREGQYVGLIFDGNIQGLVGDYAYSEEQARAVAVHSSGILEALTRIYGMDALARELTDAGK